MTRKLTLYIDGIEVDQSPPAIFEKRTISSGTEQLVLGIPDGMTDLFRRVCTLIPPPYYLLYILHTPRGEGEPGRYQSTVLSLQELTGFLDKYRLFLAGDARHDVWVYSLTSEQTLVWDRHNHLFVEGGPFERVTDTLYGLGFVEGEVERIGGHCHHYRREFDADAADVLRAFDWYRTPLLREDEQWPSTLPTQVLH